MGNDMTMRERTAFLQEMLCVINPRIFLTEYDASFAMRWSGAEEADKSILLFLIEGSDEREVCRQLFSEDRTPVILTDRFSMVYAAVISSEDTVFLLGPFFVSENSEDAARRRIWDMNPDGTKRQELDRFLRRVPVMDAIKLMEYTLMLEKAAAGESLSISSIRYTGNSSISTDRKDPAEEEAAYHGTYADEQLMLRMVREGDVENLEKQMNRMAHIGKPGLLALDSARQMKNLVEVNIILFSRAAIEGGLPAEDSLSLTDYYFQAVEGSRDLASLANIARTMQKDFVTRVFNVQQDRKYSKDVRRCCAYVFRHLEEPIVLGDMAKYCGLSEYYLTRRFREETGTVLSLYIRAKRLERAQFLLKTTNLPIHAVSDRLQFGSQSYFTALFKKAYGISPSAFREQNQLL